MILIIPTWWLDKEFCLLDHKFDPENISECIAVNICSNIPVPKMIVQAYDCHPQSIN